VLPAPLALPLLPPGAPLLPLVDPPEAPELPTVASRPEGDASSSNDVDDAPPHRQVPTVTATRPTHRARERFIAYF
jgi:hypothetical protein